MIGILFGGDFWLCWMIFRSWRFDKGRSFSSDTTASIAKSDDVNFLWSSNRSDPTMKWCAALNLASLEEKSLWIMFCAPKKKKKKRLWSWGRNWLSQVLKSSLNWIFMNEIQPLAKEKCCVNLAVKIANIEKSNRDFHFRQSWNTRKRNGSFCPIISRILDDAKKFRHLLSGTRDQFLHAHSVYIKQGIIILVRHSRGHLHPIRIRIRYPH